MVLVPTRNLNPLISPQWWKAIVATYLQHSRYVLQSGVQKTVVMASRSPAILQSHNLHFH